LKVVSIAFDAFPPSKYLNVEPDEISECLLNMNNEICVHIDKCEAGQQLIDSLSDQHSFDINLRLITDSLVEHLKKSLDGIKITKKDLFISLYQYSKNTSSLEYLLHFDQKRDLVRTKSIPLESEQFKNYESVKCMNSPNLTAVVLNKKDYAQGLPKRYRTLQHYIGLKLEMNGSVFGFINIEFHNNALFTDEDSMISFMEENVFPFKLLFEYQFLKRQFFRTFSDFRNNWRVT